MADYQAALSELEKAELTEEERVLVSKAKAGEIKSWKELEAELLVPYEVVLGEAGKREFNEIFLPRAKSLYPNPSEAAAMVAYHMYTASSLQPPKNPGDYFAAALPEPRRGFRFFR